MKTFTLTLTGTRPLLMHNSRLVDPLDPHTKELAKLTKTAKSTKSDADIAAVSHSEFVGGIYFDDDLGPVLPSINLEAAIKKASFAVSKISKDKVTASLKFNEDVTPLAYSGPRNIAELWGDGHTPFVHRASVKVGQNRVMRTRPKFDKWAAEFTGMFDETVLDPEQFQLIMEYVGPMIGVGDWRPRFGTFTHELEVH